MVSIFLLFIPPDWSMMADALPQVAAQFRCNRCKSDATQRSQTQLTLFTILLSFCHNSGLWWKGFHVVTIWGTACCWCSVSQFTNAVSLNSIHLLRGFTSWIGALFFKFTETRFTWFTVPDLHFGRNWRPLWLAFPWCLHCNSLRCHWCHQASFFKLDGDIAIHMLHTRACCREVNFSKSLAWVFFWCLFMFRIGLKNFKKISLNFSWLEMDLKIWPRAQGKMR